MRTNIVIDDELLDRAMQTSGLPTRQAAVEAGLRLLIQVHEQKGIRGLPGKFRSEVNLEEARRERAAGKPIPTGEDDEEALE